MRFALSASPCEVEHQWAENQQASYIAATKEVAREFKNVLILDPFPVLCEGEACSASAGGRLLYRDSNHLSVYGSEYVFGRLLGKRDYFRLWFESDPVLASHAP